MQENPLSIQEEFTEKNESNHIELGCERKAFLFFILK